MTDRTNVIRIDDPADPRLEDYRDIRDRDLRGAPGRPGLFIAESAIPVEKLLSIPGLSRSVLIAPKWIDRIAPLSPAGVPVYVAPHDILEAVAGFDVHRGALAVGYRPPAEQLTIDHVVPRETNSLTVLLCDDINNIENMGMLFRNAAAFGVDAVVLSPRSHDPLYRRCVRVSVGHVLSMPWARSDDWPGDLHRLKKDWGLSLVGAMSGEGAVDLHDLIPPKRIGLVVGQEFSGLSPETVAHCHHRVRIPMAPGIDSLNVAVAAAVCLDRLSRGERA